VSIAFRSGREIREKRRKIMSKSGIRIRKMIKSKMKSKSRTVAEACSGLTLNPHLALDHLPNPTLTLNLSPLLFASGRYGFAHLI
jgi:hypothetical protein